MSDRAQDWTNVLIGKARREMDDRHGRFCIVSLWEFGAGHVLFDLHAEAADETFETFREAAARARELNMGASPQ